MGGRSVPINHSYQPEAVAAGGGSGLGDPAGGRQQVTVTLQGDVEGSDSGGQATGYTCRVTSGRSSGGRAGGHTKRAEAKVYGGRWAGRAVLAGIYTHIYGNTITAKRRRRRSATIMFTRSGLLGYGNIRTVRVSGLREGGRRPDNHTQPYNQVTQE